MFAKVFILRGSRLRLRSLQCCSYCRSSCQRRQTTVRRYSLSTRLLGDFSRYRRARNEPRSRKVISLVFRNHPNVRAYILGASKSGEGDACGQVRIGEICQCLMTCTSLHWQMYVHIYSSVINSVAMPTLHGPLVGYGVCYQRS